MTLSGRSLDPERLFRNDPLEVFRLASAKYANLSGIGAARYPGRWNRLAEEAIYTSTERGVSLLEKLVHLADKAIIPANLATLTLHVSGNWKPHRNYADILVDENTGASFVFFRTLFEANEAFQRRWVDFDEKPFAVALPSIVVPVWNVVLFPEAHGFVDHVTLKSIEREDPLDERLFPAKAVFDGA